MGRAREPVISPITGSRERSPQAGGIHLAELVLLSFDRAEIAALHRASINGEPAAVRFFETWQDHFRI